MVEMVPSPAATFRIRSLRVSAINRLPLVSTANPPGMFNAAALAGPPSPANPANPIPATTVCCPLSVSTR